MFKFTKKFQTKHLTATFAKPMLADAALVGGLMCRVMGLRLFVGGNGWKGWCRLFSFFCVGLCVCEKMKCACTVASYGCYGVEGGVGLLSGRPLGL